MEQNWNDTIGALTHNYLYNFKGKLARPVLLPNIFRPVAHVREVVGADLDARGSLFDELIRRIQYLEGTQ